MATYVSTIASLPAVHGLAGVNFLPASAPAVQAGTPLDLADVSRARKEKSERQTLRSFKPDLVTDEEVSDAKVREEAIVSQHVNAKYAGAGQPDWLMPALATALAPVQQDLQAVQQDLRQELQAVRQDLRQELQAVRQDLRQELQAVRQDLRRMEAAVLNQKQAVRNARRAPLDLPLSALLKAKPGHPHNTNPNDLALTALPQPVDVGTSLPPLAFIPAAGITRAEIMGLTGVQIDDLAWFYNESFSRGEFFGVWCSLEHNEHKF